jgi:hypothetical protein
MDDIIVVSSFCFVLFFVKMVSLQQLEFSYLKGEYNPSDENFDGFPVAIHRRLLLENNFLL